MNEYEYQIKSGKIKRKNRIWFGVVIGGLAALTLGTKIWISNPDIPYQQRKNLYDHIYNISTSLMIGVSVFFTSRERNQLKMLDDEYNEQFRKRKR